MLSSGMAAALQAALKVVARIQRYEALPHRIVTLELALHHFAMGKYARSWELLVQVRAAGCGFSCQLFAGACWPVPHRASARISIVRCA